MKILLIGYGKMGKTIEKLAIERGHTIAGKVDVNNMDLLPQLLDDADVAIEFTQPETAYDNILECINSNTPVVSGTTGWLDQYDAASKHTLDNNGALFYSSNYSIGVNVFFELNKYLAKLMNNFTDYDVLTEEHHHIQKKDSPSGTAITIAEGILENLDRKTSWKENSICENNELSIYAKRIGKVYGYHDVQYHNEIDTIKISHNAFSREGFANGAIKAAEWLLDKKGVFGMQDMLGLSKL